MFKFVDIIDFTTTPGTTSLIFFSLDCFYLVVKSVALCKQHGKQFKGGTDCFDDIESRERVWESGASNISVFQAMTWNEQWTPIAGELGGMILNWTDSGLFFFFNCMRLTAIKRIRESALMALNTYGSHVSVSEFQSRSPQEPGPAASRPPKARF